VAVEVGAQAVAGVLLVGWAVWRLAVIFRGVRQRQWRFTVPQVRGALWPALVLVAVLGWWVRG